MYPNPFRGNTTFSITGLNAEERTTLDVYTIDGVLVANVFTGAVDQQGSYRLTWDASNLKTGMYFYRLISGGRVTSGKLKSE
ncbi:MAG: T9SS type A sorting domain-containing protein [Flavobacteriales bacterium]|nr:T9SS type A sorting domain-containing protein [Flavobacteriales bacterium]